MSAEFEPGTGKVSAALSITLGLLGLAGVLCLLFPEYLTTAELRPRYPLPLLRIVLQAGLAVAFAFGVYGALHGRYRRRSTAGIVLAVVATVLGGGSVPIETPVPSARSIGLDWFVLNLFLTALVFIPIERAFARLPEQRIFRLGFKTDVAHFALSHLLVQVSMLLMIIPAGALLRWATRLDLQPRMADLPLWAQFISAVILTDLFFYAIHRLFHEVPALWRFHAIHHSSVALDWLAASRIHLVDAIVTRAVSFIPLGVLGFDPQVIGAYFLFVSAHAVFNHANVAWSLPALDGWIATPRFHHWHHAAEPEAVDKNLAAHLPVIDKIFGTYYAPKRWPARYGIAGNPVPAGFLPQLMWPLRSAWRRG